MAETSAASNNKSVNFRSKPEREMSTHQRMNAEGQRVNGGESMAKPPKPAKPSSWNNRGISNSEGKGPEPAGVENKAPMKMSKKGSRKTAKRAINRGMISEKAAKRHLGDY